MRVQQLTGRRPRDERGATAVTVALFLVALLGIGAFTIDLGMSYASTRQLQTASDAAALAAANVFKKTPGTSCAAVLTAGATAAQSAANAIREENRDASTGTQYSAACVNGSIEVTYTSQGTTSRFLGQLLGRTDDYTTQRSATARVATVTIGTGVRPYAICASQIPADALATGNVFKMSLPSSGNTECPGAGNSGNWWTINCPETGNNSNQNLADKTRYGCSDPVDIVPNQITDPARTPQGLRTYLESYCDPFTNDVASCLNADPGGIGGNNVLDSMQYLVDEQVRMLLPVFCGGQPNGACDTAAVVNAGGNNPVYPVHALVGAQICGYHFGNGNNTRYPNGGLLGDCAGFNPLNLSTTPGGPQDNYMLLRLVDVPVLGADGVAPCPLGSACDKARVAFLIR